MYGEGLGRLKNNSCVNLGLDVFSLIELVELKLKQLQKAKDYDNVLVPKLIKLKCQ